MYRIIVLIFLLISIGGCSEYTIDTSTDESMKSSVQKVKSSLSIDKQKEFDNSLKILMFSNVNLSNIFANSLAGKTIDKDKMLNDMKKSLDGKTGLEVIALAEVIKKKRAKQRKEVSKKRVQQQKNREVSELEALRIKKQVYDKNKKELLKFKVVSSVFTKELQNEYSSRTQPIISLIVKNETKHPISRAYFRGTLQSKGRSIPWLVDNFNYQISGGIEPNEKASWRLAPNMFSEWGKVNSPKDAIFTVVIERIDGVKGKKLFSIRDFTEQDKDRLKELEKKY